MINAAADGPGVKFLPEQFKPSEKDVVIGWARQNHRHGKTLGLRSAYVS